MDNVNRITEIAKLAPRELDAHKGDFGRVLVVGGSSGMVGAPALAADAALRGGVGLVTMAVPEPVQQAVATLCRCATSVPLACERDGVLAPASVRQMVGAAEQSDVLAVGPGFAVGPDRQNIVRAVLDQSRPVVLDADGLNNLVSISNWPQLRACPLILTPHPGEFARLTGAGVEDVQADRQGAAVDAARRWAGEGDLPLVCVLKGAGTVVADRRRVWVNDTGNPGMATGGSGDILTGLLAAMIAQGLAPFDAACLAVRLHGRAGDLAAAELGGVSLTAVDLLDYLPAALREIA
jgi:NAD(P)H-hydrate epimerase